MRATGSPGRFRFGVFELDLRAAELRREGLRVKLRGRPIEILATLLERPGEVVDREELRARLWPADTFVDFDHGLNSSINRLREALGDAADNPRFVETVPRRGYRFIAPVSREGEATGAPELAAASPSAERPAGPEALRRRRGVAAALVALALAAAVALVWLSRRSGSADPVPGPLRIAVLPFKSLSGEDGHEYLADGMTDALITELAQLHSLRVISRTTAMVYKGSTRTLSEIAGELGVDAVVEGSVLRQGDRARINAQLVDPVADRGLWARSYACDLEDVIDVQRRVAREITESVRVAVSEDERALLERSSPIDPAAYEAFVRGRVLREELTDDALARSRQAFETAVAIAPDYAAAWAALADVHRVTGAAGYDSAVPEEAARQARAAAERALELDPEEPVAHATLGMIARDYDWDWEAAEARLTRALELRPSFALGHLWYSGFLTARGRFDESIEAARRAQELDPMSRRARLTLGIRYYYARRYAEAERELERVLEEDPGAFAARLTLGQARLERGDPEGAVAALERAALDSQGNAWALGALGYAYAAAGRPVDAREVLGRLDALSEQRHVTPFARALVHTGLGEAGRAIDALEEAYRERSGWMPFLGVEPSLDRLRGHPRFAALLSRIGPRDGSGRSRS